MRDGRLSLRSGSRHVPPQELPGVDVTGAHERIHQQRSLAGVEQVELRSKLALDPLAMLDASYPEQWLNRGIAFLCQIGDGNVAYRVMDRDHLLEIQVTRRLAFPR